MPAARSLLPFVRMSYAQQSCYQWFDDGGEAREVTQAEGGEQGDPLTPLLFAIGIQGALEEVAAALLPGEQLCAFLDDLYILCTTCWRQFCIGLRGTGCTKVKHECGTKLGFRHKTSKIWVLKCGNRAGSRC